MAHSDATKAKIAAGVLRNLQTNQERRKQLSAAQAEFFARGRAPNKGRFEKGRHMTDAAIAQAVANLSWDPLSQRKRRQLQIRHEEAEADKLRAQGYEVFSPTIVCDRIAIKDGRAYFVEFKKPGQALRAGQKRLQDAAPEQYLVVYSPVAQQVERVPDKHEAAGSKPAR